MNTTYSTGIPVRNEEQTIVQTIESVLKQTIPPNEIHVCVNASTDNTLKKVSDVALAEKRINVISSSPGKANAWKKIVDESIDNTMLFCDGDVVINPEAAENMFSKFKENEKLVLVGGSNAYNSIQENTIFSKYFTENLSGKPIKQDWVCGRLYMAKINELYELSKKKKIELMPSNTINEDGFLEMLTKDHREIISSAYNLSMQVTSFHDWKIGFKRILAGQKQLKESYPHLFGDSDFSMKRLKNYVTRFQEVKGVTRKAGITSLFLLRTALNIYYKTTNNLDYNPVWEETTSTKKPCYEIRQQN